jgi:hypothetical protein
MDNHPLNNFITIGQYTSRYSWPNEKAMRWLIYTAEEKGIGNCFIRVGRRVLVDEKAFLNWLESNRGR